MHYVRNSTGAVMVINPIKKANAKKKESSVIKLKKKSSNSKI